MLFRSNDQLLEASEYGPLIVAYRDGAPVRVADIATVENSVEDIRTAGLCNGRPAITLIIFRQPNANIIGTVDRIKSLLPQLKAAIPADIDLTMALDRTTTIRASVEEVEFTLLISIALVILVVFLFLRNVPATLIPSVAVPVSLVGTFGVMYLAGYSVNNLSLMALAIATGFVVDDAIVVVENISRHLEQGATPLQASIRGAQEIGFTVLSISVSLVAVFIPILLMGGIVGRLFREFSVTLSAAIVVSLVVSLTTTPMMCAGMLKSRSEMRHGWLYRASERVFDGILRLYAVSLTRVLRHPLITLLITLSTIGFTVYLYIIIPKGFFPQQDTGRLTGMLRADQDTSFRSMSRLLNQFAAVVSNDPVVAGVTAFTGGSGGSSRSTSTARMFVTLKPLAERKMSADEVIARIRSKASKIPGAALLLQAVQDLRAGGRSSSAQYQFTLQGDNLRDLNAWGPKVLRELRKLPEIVDINSDQQNRGLQSSLTIDRLAAARMGISTRVIDDTLYDAFGQRIVSTMYKPLNQYRVILEVDPEYSHNPDALRHIYLRGRNGAQIPLSALCSDSSRRTPVEVNHSGQFPSVTFSFNLPPGSSLGEAVTSVASMIEAIGLPESIQGTFAETARAFQDSLSNMPLLILAALVTVYIVLGVLYESYIHPITILSTLPSAGVGALLALLYCRIELNVMALIGILLLIGIVKKNAIMMIDFALDAERKEGKSPESAIYEACLLRFRPIVMTTLAALLGGLPLALGTGTGAELRRPLGIAIVGGLAFSQILTLYTTPVVYLYLDRFRLWADRRRIPVLQRHLFPDKEDVEPPA